MTEQKQKYTTKETLSNTAVKVYDYIVSYKHLHDGIPPTLREIVEFIPEISSTSHASHHLKFLERAGLIKRDPAMSSRNILVTNGQWRIKTTTMQTYFPNTEAKILTAMNITGHPRGCRCTRCLVIREEPQFEARP